jgi:FMN phosphatase YigB (HAD superfamily)
MIRAIFFDLDNTLYRDEWIQGSGSIFNRHFIPITANFAKTKRT